MKMSHRHLPGASVASVAKQHLHLRTVRVSPVFADLSI